jgi:hypothetical protein
VAQGVVKGRHVVVVVVVVWWRCKGREGAQHCDLGVFCWLVDP